MKTFFIMKSEAIYLYFRILLNLSFRNMKVRYRQAVIGVLWAALKPTITVLIFLVVFKFIIKMNIKTGISYELYLLSGIIPWFFFSQTFNDMVLSMLDNPNFISKISISKTIIPLSYLMVNCIELSFSLLVYILISIFLFGENISLYFMLALFLLIVFSFTISLSFSVLIVFYRDIKHIIPIILQAGIFLSPIAYPISLVPERFLYLYFLNPITGIIEIFRFFLIEGYYVQIDYLIISLISGSVLSLISISVYNKFKNRLAELI